MLKKSNLTSLVLIVLFVVVSVHGLQKHVQINMYISLLKMLDMDT